jgi:transglutaminase-like cysteine proteinase BTLCP
VVAEIVAQAYDSDGRAVFRPSKKRFRWFAPNAPMQRYIAQPLKLHCRDLKELRHFILGCRYLSDKEQFGQLDYWNTPDDFEKRRRGDCDDFALWTWRQLIGMGYDDVRFVVGTSGRYGGGHAWVQFSDHGRRFLLDPLRGHLSPWLPRLATIRYRPEMSVTWDGNRLRYFEHEERVFNPPVPTLPRLVVEWLLHWALTRPRYYFLVFLYLGGKLRGSRRGLTSRLSGPA